jgi:hypothetical protein
VADLDPIAKNAVEAHAQAGESRTRPFALLQAGDPLPGGPGVLDDRRQRLAPRLADQTPVVERQRGLFHQRVLKQTLEIAEGREILASRDDDSRGPGRQGGSDLGQGLQAGPEPDQIAGVSDAQGGPAGQALEISHAGEQGA